MRCWQSAGPGSLREFRFLERHEIPLQRIRAAGFINEPDRFAIG